MTSRNHLPPGLFFAVFLLSATAWAGAHYSPQPCTPKELELTVVNLTAEELPFWIQVRDASGLQELPQSAPPRAKTTIPGTSFLTPGAAFSVRQADQELSFLLECRGTVAMTTLASPRVEYEAAEGRYVLRLQNLHHSSQNVRVSYVSKDGLTLHEVTVHAGKNYVSSEHRLNAPRGTATVLLEGEARLSSQLMSAQTGRPLLATVPSPAKLAAPARAYFLIANDSRTQSYVLPLDDDSTIARARAAMRADWPKIVFADIEPAPAGTENRDLLAPDAAPWSWRVKRVLSFSDFGHQDCSGSPGSVEDFREVWMPGPKVTCFWNFRVQRELTREEVSSGRLRP